MIQSTAPLERLPDVLACVPARLERELTRALGPRVHIILSLDISRIEETLRRGESQAVVVDPSVVSPDFLDRLIGVITPSTAFLVIWTTFSKSTLPAILRAAATCRTEVLYRNGYGGGIALRNWLIAESPRSALLRKLSRAVEQWDPTLSIVVLGVLTGRVAAASVRELARLGGVGRRKFERHMIEAGFCHPKPLIHLGRLVTAFESIAQRQDSVELASTAAGYKSAGLLWKNSRLYLLNRPGFSGGSVS
jgi:hypothetical protein